MKFQHLFYCLFFISLWSCQTDTEKVPQERKKVKIPTFAAQGAYDLVEAQVNLGPRCPECPGADKAIDWMSSELKSAGWEVIKQTFDATLYTGKEVRGTNVIGRYNPHVKERVMLCAHWDSRMIADKDTTRKEEPIAGANDGASGVGVILQIAKTISENPIPMGVDVVFFDLEDQGKDGSSDEYSWGLGSQYWAKNLPDDPYEVKYGILLDMVGAPDAEFPKEYYSMQNAKPVVDKVWKVASILKKGNYFVNRRIGGITDDHKFIMEYARFPVIDIIHHKDDKFMAAHHTHADDMRVIDKKTLGAVGQVVLSTVYKESNGDF